MKKDDQTAGEVFELKVTPYRDGGFTIQLDGQGMLLPGGETFYTPSRTYAEFVLETLSKEKPDLFDKNTCRFCHERTLFIDFSTGFVAPNGEDFRKFQTIVAWCSTYDPIHALCAGPEVVDQLAKLGPFHQFCTDRGVEAPNWAQDSNFGDSNKESVEEVLRAKGGRKIDATHLSYFRCIEREFGTLSLAQKSVVYSYFTFCSGGGSLIILPLLLVKGLCSPKEFAEAFLATIGVIPGVFSDVSVAAYRRSKRKITRDAERALFFLKHH